MNQLAAFNGLGFKPRSSLFSLALSLTASHQRTNDYNLLGFRAVPIRPRFHLLINARPAFGFGHDSNAGLSVAYNLYPFRDFV